MTESRPPAEPELDLIAASGRGDRDAQRRLVARIMPVVRAQVAATAMRMSGTASSPEARDVLQDVLVELLRDGCRALRRWDPARGLSLDAFVRLVARRFAFRRLARQRTVDHRLEVTLPEVLEALGRTESGLESRDELDTILHTLYGEMSERDRELFERLFLEEQSSAEVALALGMSADALKKWRSRFYARARDVAARLERRVVP